MRYISKYRNALGELLVRTINGKDYYSAIIKVMLSVDEGYLIKNGILIGTKAGNIWTVHIPIDRKSFIDNDRHISYVQYDKDMGMGMGMGPDQPRYTPPRTEPRIQDLLNQKEVNEAIIVPAKNANVKLIALGAVAILGFLVVTKKIKL